MTPLHIVHDHAARLTRRAVLQRKNAVLTSGAALRAALGRVLTEVGFVHFNAAATTTERHGERARAHRFADTMGHEPRGLVSDAKRTMQLMGAHALLGRANELHRQEPFVQGDFRALEHRANGHGKRLTAIATEVEARTVGLAL